MRQFLSLLSIISLIVLLSGSCRKNRSGDPLSQLPPETQTGARTFGCLVDGQVFTPKGSPFAGPIKKAAYQYVNGKYSLLISGRSSSSSGTVLGVGIQGDSVSMSISKYELVEYNVSGNLSGSFAEFALGNINDYYTNSIDRGELTITKFDPVNLIVSGTFWFDARNASGKIVQVREGRFDLPYVK